MPIIPIDIGFASWGGPNAGSFRPNGKLHFHGDRSAWDKVRFLSDNPIRHGGKTGGKNKDVWAARLFVGLNIGPTPRWSADDVIKIVRDVRMDQVGQADASFITQRGLYTQMIGGRPDIVEEDSIQVMISNLPHWGVGKGKFKKQMIELAETVAAKLGQDTVILEIQKNGLVKFSWTIEP
jgi:hypothetical protein